jgi:hypothetical protein
MSCSNLKDNQREYRRIVTRLISLNQVEEIWNRKRTRKIDELKNKEKTNRMNRKLCKELCHSNVSDGKRDALIYDPHFC